MTSGAAQLQFAAQLTLFVVALVGLSLSARPDVLSRSRRARWMLGAGFAAIAVSSILVGADLVTDPGMPAVVALRVLGALLAGVAMVRWRWSSPAGPGGTWTGAAMVAGLAVVVGAGVARLAGAGRLADVLGFIGAMLAGGALVFASRRSIPARIGADAAGLILGVLLAVSLALSVAVTRNVEDEALRRYGSRASREATAAVNTAKDSLSAAHLVAADLTRSSGPDLAVLAGPASSVDQKQAAQTRLGVTLAGLVGDAQLGIGEPVGYIDAGGFLAGVAPSPSGPVTRVALARAPAVTEAAATGQPREAISVVGDRAYAVGAVPVLVRVPGGTFQPRGVVAVATPLDSEYLGRLQDAGEPLGLALVTPDRVVASVGTTLPEDDLTSVAAHTTGGEAMPNEVIDGRFVVARPVAGSEQTMTLTFVVSVPTSTVAKTRTDLFRILFLVALGSAVAGVALAIYVGSRIGRGVGDLAGAAERIRAGDLSATTGVQADDELGALGSTFDAMADSLRTMTTDLEHVAADEARLRSRLSAVIGSMTEALLAAGTDGLVIECNRSAEELLGRPAGTVVGRSLDDVAGLVDPDTGEPVSLTSPRGSGSGVRAGEAVVGGAAGPIGDGPPREPLPVAYSAAAVSEDDGSAAGTVVLLRDLRNEREVDDMKTQFLANISHELRTPLTPIKGYAAALGRGTVDQAGTVEFAGRISAGVHQLERVIGQLVNFATMAAGRLHLQLEPLDPAVVARDASDRWAARVPGQVRVRPLVADGLPPVSADRGHVDQALDELLDNAVKFSPDGGDIIVEADLAEGGRVRFSVTDHGIGLGTERTEPLTGAFAQADASATRRFGGLGLGLALVDRIARAHGGTLTWDAPEQAAVRFSLFLPVEGDPDPG